MGSSKSENDKPGSEVAADKRRNDPYPKMEGDQWHEQAERANLEPEVMAGEGAITGEPIDGSPDREGMKPTKGARKDEKD